MEQQETAIALAQTEGTEEEEAVEVAEKDTAKEFLLDADPEKARLSAVNEVFERTIETYHRLAISIQNLAMHESGLVRARQEIESCRERLAELKNSYAKHLSAEDLPTWAWDFPLEVVTRYVWPGDKDIRF